MACNWEPNHIGDVGDFPAFFTTCVAGDLTHFDYPTSVTES